MARTTKTATAKAKAATEAEKEAATEAAPETLEAKEAEVKTEKEPAAAVEKKTAEVEKQEGPIMYVGPTIPGFGIQNRVSIGIPEDVQGTVEKHPILQNLFVEIKEYPKAEKQIREEKGYIYSAYKTALELKQKGEI